jgi:hypothetical protein
MNPATRTLRGSEALAPDPGKLSWPQVCPHLLSSLTLKSGADPGRMATAHNPRVPERIVHALLA